MRSTDEDRQGKLWVCTVAGVDAFDPRTERVTERIQPEHSRVAINDKCSKTTRARRGSSTHPGTGWPRTIAGLGDSRCNCIRIASRPRSEISGALGFHEVRR